MLSIAWSKQGLSMHRGKKPEFSKLQIYADADHLDEFTSFHQRLGMSQREAGSRLFAWFNRQSPLIRQQILQPMPDEVAPDIAKIILERMAEQAKVRDRPTPSNGKYSGLTSQTNEPSQPNSV